MIPSQRESIAIVLAVTALLAGCSGQPGWVKSDRIFFEQKDIYHFRGEVDHAYDLALGKRQAEADAKRRLVEKVRMDAIAEFRELVRGSNTAPGDVGRFTEDMFQSEAKVNVSGITAVKSYWEQAPADSSDSKAARPLHIYALVTIDKKDFNQAKEALIAASIGKTRPDSEAERLLDQWKRRQRNSVEEWR